MSILIFQQKGMTVDWVDVAHIGPFKSADERAKYIAANPVDGYRERYVVRWLHEPWE